MAKLRIHYEDHKHRAPLFHVRHPPRNKHPPLPPAVASKSMYVPVLHRVGNTAIAGTEEHRVHTNRPSHPPIPTLHPVLGSSTRRTGVWPLPPGRPCPRSTWFGAAVLWRRWGSSEKPSLPCLPPRGPRKTPISPCRCTAPARCENQKTATDMYSPARMYGMQICCTHSQLDAPLDRVSPPHLSVDLSGAQRVSKKILSVLFVNVDTLLLISSLQNVTMMMACEVLNNVFEVVKCAMVCTMKPRTPPLRGLTVHKREDWS